MKRKYTVERVYYSEGKFINFGSLQITVKSNSPVYNIKWMFDRRRSLKKCPKCGGGLIGEHIEYKYNQIEKRIILVSRCLKCCPQPPDKILIEVLKNGEHFDIFKAINDGDYKFI